MKYATFIMLLALSILPERVDAQEAEYISARLVPGQTGAENGPVDMALQIDLKDGWYTYWRMPGDSGLAPVFDWQGSENVAKAELFWPAPQRFTTMDLQSFGYLDKVVFPLSVTPIEAGKDITLHLKADLMVCKNICIPQTVTMMRVFHGGEAASHADSVIVNAAQETLPKKQDKNLSIDTVVLGQNAVVITARSRNGWSEPVDAIVETDEALLTAPPEILRQAQDSSVAILKIPAPEGMNLATELFGKTVNILLIKDSTAIEKKVTF